MFGMYSAVRSCVPVSMPSPLVSAFAMPAVAGCSVSGMERPSLSRVPSYSPWRIRPGSWRSR